MESYFASPQRASDEELKLEIEFVSQNSVVQGLLQSVSGVLAVLDEHRQVVAVNDSFLQMLGIENSDKVLGLRTGEVLQCVHCHDEPAGCGTTKFCSTCGAAIAIVSTLADDSHNDRICAITSNRDGIETDTSFLVRSTPLKIAGQKFVLLFLQDITIQEQRAALERTFFHDVTNTLTGIIGASEMLYRKNPDSRLAAIVHKSAMRLSHEIAIQKCLLKNDNCEYTINKTSVTAEQVLQEVNNIFSSHQSAINKRLQLPEPPPDIVFNTDLSLYLRVLCNMLTNAFEATEENGEVRLWFEKVNDAVAVSVWNRQMIPENISFRVFQRNFSTKNQAGRGIGTYSMKLFGERFLGGKVSFTSSEDGTTFVFSLPLSV